MFHQKVTIIVIQCFIIFYNKKAFFELTQLIAKINHESQHSSLISPVLNIFSFLDKTQNLHNEKLKSVKLQ